MPEKARMVVFCVMFIFMLAPLHVLAQGPPCSYTDETSGVKYDFTKLSTSDFSTTAGGYTYNLRVCGTSEQKCPNDPDQITTGMAVQTKNTGGFGSNCYVLGQYDSSVTSANWAALDGGKGVSLTLANGSPSRCPEGTPRAVQVNFECAAAEVDNSLIDNTDCEYTFHHKTCMLVQKAVVVEVAAAVEAGASEWNDFLKYFYNFRKFFERLLHWRCHFECL